MAGWLVPLSADPAAPPKIRILDSKARVKVTVLSKLKGS
jgi:hypothetical protein